MSDQFFEDEESLTGETSAPASTKAAGRAKAASPRRASASPVPAQRGTRRPPSFFMVVVITVVALILGFALGYFTALNTWSSKLEADHAVTAGTTQAASGSAAADAGTSVNEEAGLPEGHPDLASLMNADGSIDEEKLAAYKAQLEAARAASNGGDADSSAAGE